MNIQELCKILEKENIPVKILHFGRIEPNKVWWIVYTFDLNYAPESPIRSRFNLVEPEKDLLASDYNEAIFEIKSNYEKIK